jgi:large-conductance mechanosensitive channel
MTPLILLAIIAGLPVLLALLLRVNAVFLFMSVAAGNLLVRFVGDDADLALGMVLRDADAPIISKFVLQLLPVILTILLLRKTLPRSKMLFHVLPSIATGLSLGVFVLTFFNTSVQKEVYDSPYGDVLKTSQDVIVAAAVVLTLLLAWITYRNKDAKPGRHHK